MSSTVERLEEATQRACSVLLRTAADGPRTSGSDGDENGADRPSLVQQITALDDDALAQLMSDAAHGRAEFDTIITVAAGVAAKRSEWSQGQAGLAQRNGHRNAVRFVQSVTGASRGEAARQVRLGGAMGEADAAERLLRLAGAGSEDDGSSGDSPTGDGSGPGAGASANGHDASDAPKEPAVLPWSRPVTSAVEEGTITPAAGDAIVRGLGEPSRTCDIETLRAAASELVDDARKTHVDELFRTARRMRDEIDPAGVQERWQRRYDKRSWIMRRNNDGQLTAHVVFDDESGVFATQLLDIALSPRRGGPRFVSEAEKAWSDTLLADPRTNEQLAFDTMLDVLRCGAECDDSTTFRTHRPAVRVLIARDEGSPSGIGGIGHLEGSDDAIPLAVVESRLCDAGSQLLIADSCGNPLDLGREQRLFTSKQRTALRARDGGCVWPECDSRAWACEAHHTITWHKDHGRTDVADGVLLCRFHHLLLHNKGWKIERDTPPTGTRYLLIPPASVDPERVPIELRSKSSGWIHHRRRTLRHRLTPRGQTTTPPPVAFATRT
jgi:hypothetical protein